MIEFFSSSPEAVSTLLALALSGLVTIFLFIYTLFANYPIIVRLLANTSLVSVDSALQKKVKVTFEHLGQIREIHELRQIELEIFNSHPRQLLADKTITIHLKSDRVTILGVTAANINNQTPEIGGRRIITRVEQVPTMPPDHLLGMMAQSFYPALVVFIPYLDRVTENDRIFLRITYDGPLIIPEVQGAKFKSAYQYHTHQKYTVYLTFVFFLIAALFFVLYASGKAPDATSLAADPMFRIATRFILASVIPFFLVMTLEIWWQKWMRTLPNPLIPPPYEPEDLVKLYYHDTMKN